MIWMAHRLQRFMNIFVSQNGKAAERFHSKKNQIASQANQNLIIKVGLSFVTFQSFWMVSKIEYSRALPDALLQC